MTGPDGLRLGELAIHPVVEAPAAPPVPIFRPEEFFPGIDPALVAEHRGWLAPRFLDPAHGTLRLRIQSYLVRTPDRTVLVDTCVGNHKPRPAQPFWDGLDDPSFEAALAAAGTTPAQVDVVVCTHLHVDHVGWNTRRDGDTWVPTFPNATYVFASEELGTALERAAGAPGQLPWIEDSVRPVIEAGLARTVPSGDHLDEEIALVAAPGHTPGHVAVRVEREGPAALFVGDLFHSPLQLRRPDLTMRADHDAGRARASRRRILEEACGTDTVVLPAHVPLSAAGRIERSGDGYAFRAP